MALKRMKLSKSRHGGVTAANPPSQPTASKPPKRCQSRHLQPRLDCYNFPISSSAQFELEALATAGWLAGGHAGCEKTMMVVIVSTAGRVV
jgi:hypothetical protein